MASVVDTPSVSEKTRAKLPTFFIIGAPKSGTTSLHAYLDEHPEISMSAVKEPMVFEPPHWIDRLSEYQTLFAPGTAVRGESSTAYASFPWVPEIPDRIRATVPEARLVYLVRDPIPRTLAHYAQNVWDRFPVRPFDELMDDLEWEMNMPVWCSRFATQLARWLERYPVEQVLVLDQHELLTRRTATVQRVLAFLGVDAGFSSPAWDAMHNDSPSHRTPSRIARRLGPGAVAAADRGHLPRLLSTPVPKPSLTRDQRLRLEAILRPEAERLREMTGMALEHWTI